MAASTPASSTTPAPADLAATLGGSQSSEIEFTQNDPALPPGTVPYEPHLPKRPSGSVQQWVSQLIASEGPLHEDELLQALRDDHGYGRLGANIRQEFLAAITGAERSGGVVRRGAWLWPPSLHVDQVVVRVRTGEARRRFEWYSDEELVRAIHVACTVAGALNRDGLIEATGRLLGVNVTHAVRERVSGLIEVAIESGHLIDRDGMFLAK